MLEEDYHSEDKFNKYQLELNKISTVLKKLKKNPQSASSVITQTLTEKIAKLIENFQPYNYLYLIDDITLGEKFSELFELTKGDLSDQNRLLLILQNLTEIEVIGTFLEKFNDHQAYVSSQESILSQETESINQRLNETIRVYNSRLASLDNKFGQIDLNKWNTHSSKLVEEFQKHENEIRGMIKLVSEKVIANDYEGKSINEKTLANRWTTLTGVFASLTLISIIAFMLYQINQPIQTLNYQLITGKILIAATLGFVAKWSSKRSFYHLREGDKYHRLAVNLATFKPFTSELSEEKREEIVAAIAIKIFTESTGTESNAELESLNILELLKSSLINSNKS